MSPYSPERRSARNRRKRNKTPLNAIKSAARWVLFLLVLTAVVVGVIVYRHGGDQLQEAASSILKRQFPSLQTSFDSIRLDAARGVRLTDVVWELPNDSEPTVLLEVEEVYVSCSIDLQTLIDGNFQPQKIILRRPVLHANAEPQQFLDELRLLQPQLDTQSCEIEVVDASLEIAGTSQRQSKTITGIYAKLIPQAPDSKPAGNEPTILASTTSGLQADLTSAATEYTAHDSRVRIRTISYEEKQNEFDFPSDEPPQGSTSFSSAWTIEANVSNPYVETLSLSGSVDSTSWSASGAANRLDLSALLDLVNGYGAFDFPALNTLQGKTSLDFELSGLFNTKQSLQYKIEGTASNCVLTTPILKYPLSEIEALYVFSNNYASIEKCTAHCGLTSITASYGQQGPLTSPEDAWFQGNFSNFPLDDAFLTALLTDAKEKGTVQNRQADAILHFIRNYQFSANTNVDIAVEKNAATQGEWAPSKLEIAGTSVEFIYQAFPYRLTQLHGKVTLDSHGSLSILLRSELNTAPLTIHGIFTNALTNPRGQVDVVSYDRAVDSKLIAALPPSIRSKLTELHPSGDFDSRLRITFDPVRFPKKPFRIEANFDVRDGSVQYNHFPLPISSIAGSIYMRNGAWIFHELSGKSGAANLVASGSLATGTLIDEITAEIAREYSNRAQANSTPDVHDTPYSISGTENGAEFTDVENLNIGSPAPADLFAALPVPVNEPLEKDAWRFQLSTSVENFPLGEELLAALVKYDKREEFEKLNLNGKANGQIRVAYRTDSKKLALEYEMKPIPGSTSARPEAFPFEFRDVEGLFVYREGTLIADGLRANSGRMTLSANIVNQAIPNRGWMLDVSNLRVEQFQFDRDLQSAAPNQALKFLASLNLSGCFNLDGALRVIKGAGDQAKMQALWDIRLVAQQNSAKPKVQLDAICGSAKLLGSALEGTQPILFGEFNLDSLYYKDLQFSNINGPFYFNGTDLFWGKEAPTIRRTPLYQNAYLRTRIDAEPIFQAPKQTFPPNNLGSANDLDHNRKTASFVRAQNQTETPGFITTQESAASNAQKNALVTSPDGRRSLHAKLFNGLLISDGVYNSGVTPKYRFTLNLHEGMLEDATRYFAPGSKPLKGRINARASLSGEGAAIATLKGEGDMNVKEAELYELPQIVKILQLLSIKAPDQAAFDSASVKFNVLGDRLKLTNVLLRGEALMLFGEGWLTLKGQENLIDLTLNSRLGNDSTQIPIVSDVIGEVGDQLTQIRVEGNVKSPVIHQEAAPGVKKAWWNVFPEREPKPTDKAPVEKTRPIRDAWKNLTSPKSK